MCCVCVCERERERERERESVCVCVCVCVLYKLMIMIYCVGCLSTSLHHSKIHNEDHRPSVFTCTAKTIDVCLDSFFSIAKLENVRIDLLRLLDRVQYQSPF